ncbi:hypothetical protein ES703_10728 [subsurface metagenome]
MTTLIIHKNPDGSITARCDARCYNAKLAKCTCICGGINHQKGKKQAIENTVKYRDSLIEALAAADLTFNPAQYELFEGEKP